MWNRNNAQNALSFILNPSKQVNGTRKVLNAREGLVLKKSVFTDTRFLEIGSVVLKKLRLELGESLYLKASDYYCFFFHFADA